jgi:hypothetical protein
MRLSNQEKQLIRDWYESSLDIEIIRKKYIVILRTRSYYLKKIFNYIAERDVQVYDVRSDEFHTIDRVSSSDQAIKFLQQLSLK